MAVSVTNEFDIAAPASVVMEVLMDIDALPDWSGPHKKAQVLSTHDDGTPDEVAATVSAVGFNDDQKLKYTWTDTSCTWDLVESSLLSQQHGSYTVTEAGDGAHVVFELTIDLKIKVPGMIVKRGQKTAAETAEKGLTAEAVKRANG